MARGETKFRQTARSVHDVKLDWSTNHRIVYPVLSVPYNATTMEDKLIDNETLGQYIADIETNPAEARAIRRINLQTVNYDNFKRLKSTNCHLELDGIVLGVPGGTVFDESLRSTIEWLLTRTAKKVKNFILAICTPNEAFLDFMFPLLDNAALDLSGCNNMLKILDGSYTRIQAEVYRRSTKLLDYFPSLDVLFQWNWPVPELNSTNTILVKAVLQAKNVKKAVFAELDLDAGDQLGKVIGEEVDQVHLTKLVFEKTHLSLVRFPHEIVEKSKNLTQLVIEYHPDTQKHILMGQPYVTVCEAGFDAFRKMLEAGNTITILHLVNITNLKTNDRFNIADFMPNLEYLEIRNTPNKPNDHPSLLSLDLTLTDITSLCGPSLKDVLLQVGALASVTDQSIEQYAKAALVEMQQKCPNLEVLRIQSLKSYADIKYRDDKQLKRRSLVSENHSATIHDRLIAQADTYRFTPAKLHTFAFSFTGDKSEHAIFRRIFKWDKNSGFARLVHLDYDLKNPDDFNRKVVHLPIELEELHGVPDMMAHKWAEIIESLSQAEDNIRPAELS